MTLLVWVLGPIEVGSDDERRAPGPAMQKILAVLLAKRDMTVSTDHLVDAVSGGDANGRSRLHSNMHNLRKLLDEGRIEVRDGGYRFVSDGVEIDSDRFELLADTARVRLRMRDVEGAKSAFEDALGIWRGHAYDVDERAPDADAEAIRLDELRTTVRIEYAELLIDTGAADDALKHLRPVVMDAPTREDSVRLYMRALYQCGRHTEALGVWNAMYGELVEIGAVPSPETQELFDRILRHDPELMVGSFQSDDRDHLALATLSVFNAGFPPDPARALLGSDVDLTLQRFVDAGWLTMSSSFPGRNLFTMVEPIRSRASDLLRSSGSRDSVRHALVDWAMEAADTSDPHRLLARASSAVVDALDAAMALDRTNDAARILGAVGRAWAVTGPRLEPGQTWLRRVTDVAGGSSAAIAKTWLYRGQSAVRSGDFSEAKEAFVRAFEVAVASDDGETAAWASVERAHVTLLGGGGAAVEALIDDAARFGSNDRRLAARIVLLRSQHALYTGSTASPQLIALESLTAHGDARTSDLAHGLVLLATRAQMLGDLDGASSAAQNAVELARSAADWSVASFAQYRLSSICRAHGDRERARSVARDGLRIALEVGHLALVASLLQVYAGLSADAGHDHHAALAAAGHTTIRDHLGFALNAVDQIESVEVGRTPPMTVAEAINLAWSIVTDEADL